MKKTLACSLTALLLSSTAVFAQSATPNNLPPVQGDDFVLDPIILQQGTLEDPTGPVDGYKATRSSTGTGINAEIEELPISIQVITRDVIEGTNAQRVEDAVLATSGAAVGNTFGGLQEKFLLNGLDANVANNGVVSSLNDVQTRDTANVERIEVLKGPAGALFGFNPAGGVINVTTKKPQDEFFFESNTEISSFVRLRNEYDLNVPLGVPLNAKARFIGTTEATDSFRFQDAFDDTFPENRVFFAPSLSLEPVEGLSILIRGQYLREARIFDRGIPIGADGKALADIDDFFGDPTLDDFIVETFSGDIEAKYDFNEDWSVTARAAADKNNRDGFALEPETLSAISVPGFLIGSPTDLIAGETILRQLEFRDQDTQRLTGRFDLNGAFSTSIIDHDIALSVDRTYIEVNGFIQRSGLLTPGNIDLVTLDQTGVPTNLTQANLTTQTDSVTTVDTLSFSAFDKLSYKDRIHILFGGRIDVLDQEVNNNLTGTTSRFETTEFSPRVGLVVKPFEAIPLSTFFSWGKSFEPNTQARADGTILEPQNGDTFEGGIRYNFYDGRLGATLTAFNTQLENVPTSTDGDFFVLQTITSQGIGLSLQGALTDNINISANYTYTDTEIDSVDAGGRADAVGESLVGVPEHSASLLVNYNFNDGALDGLSLTGAVRYSGRRLAGNTSTFNAGALGQVTLPAIELNSFVRVDAGATYKPNDNVAFEIGVQNLFNEEILRPSLPSIALPEAGITGLASMHIRF